MTLEVAARASRCRSVPRPRLRPKRGAILIAAAIAFAAVPQAAVASAGDLDPSFGAGGKVTTDFGATHDLGHDIGIQSDGKIVAGGSAGGNFALARYGDDGTLDPGFGAGGKVTTDFGSGGNDNGAGLAIQSDGKVVLGGSSGNPPSFALARYNVDGTLDTSFGTGGKVTTDFGTYASGEDVALQSDGKIILAGYTFDAGIARVTLARYNSDGTLDTSFGTGGKAISDLTPGSDSAFTVAIQSDDKIVVGGAGAGHFALARYNTDGTLDTSFGFGGSVTTSFGFDDVALGLAIQADGKIVAAGRANLTGSKYDFALARYDSDGTLDPGFGTAGKVVTPIGLSHDGARAVALASGGRIVAVGTSCAAPPTSCDDIAFALARYNSDGTLDATFGTGGTVRTDFTSEGDAAFGVAIQSDEKIVAVGYAATPASAENDFALARYQAGGPAADLSVTKTDSLDPVFVGQAVTYTVTAKNNGPSSATGVAVTDDLPGGVTLQSATPSQGSCTETAGTVTCDLGNLDSSSTATVEIKVIPQTDGTITNHASIHGNESDPDSANDSASESTTVNPAPPPETVSQRASAGETVSTGSTATPSDPVETSVTTPVAGTVSIEETSISQAPPSGYEFIDQQVNITAPDASAEKPLQLVFRIDASVLPEGTDATNLELTRNGTLVPDCGGSPGVASPDPCVSARTSLAGGDIELTVLTSSASAWNFAVQKPSSGGPSADLAVTQSDSPDPAHVGQKLTYTVRVTNGGPSNASGVTLSDSLPKHAGSVSAAPSQGTCAQTKTTLTCALGSLANGSAATVTIVLKPTSRGTITNTAFATALTPVDPNRSNNTSSENTTVRP